MGVGLARRGLRDHQNGGRLQRPEQRGEAADLDAHPRIEGAALEVLHRGDRAWEKLERVDAEGTRRSLELGRAGLAPRLLALDAVFEPRIGNDPMHLVRARERVYGSTVEDLVMRFRFTEADKELAHALARGVLEAGYGLAALTPGRILLGTTLADPVRRAYLAEPSRTAPLDEEALDPAQGPPPASPDGRLRRWLADFERRIWKLENDQRGGGSGFGSLKY
jgi:hypothetical protein